MLRHLACAFSAAALGVLILLLLVSDAQVAHAAVDMSLPLQMEKAVIGASESGYSLTSAQRKNTLKVLQAFAAAMPSLGWSGDDFCNWASVTCYKLTVMFTVSGVSVKGTLPDLPDDVDYSKVMITNINLFGQKSSISGTLPSSWGRLQYLVSLNMGSTSVSGTLPASWGSLHAVTFMSLPNTAIAGSLPASWSAMSSLATLILYGTQLSGTLPPEWHSMASMNILQLHQNQFTGSLPASWAEMVSLKRLSLISNNFCGCVPDSWRQASFRMLVDSKNSAADCATANSCITTTTLMPTTTTTTEAPTTTTTTEAPTTTTTKAPSECEVPHCITCVHGNPTRCEVCSSGYMVTAAQWCMKRPSVDLASLSSSTTLTAATSLGVLASVFLLV